MFGNVAFFLFCLVVAALVAAFAFTHPGSLEGAARSAIASLSIIFGLSTAVSTILHSNEANPDNVVGDPSLQDSINTKNDRELRTARLRQALLHWNALAAIIFDLVYLVMLEAYPNCEILRYSAAIFAFLTCSALIFTLRLPALLLALGDRAQYFKQQRRKRDKAQNHGRTDK